MLINQICFFTRTCVMSVEKKKQKKLQTDKEKYGISSLLLSFLPIYSVLVSLLDSMAPVSTKTRRLKKSTQWFTDETRYLKQARRKI